MKKNLLIILLINANLVLFAQSPGTSQLLSEARKQINLKQPEKAIELYEQAAAQGSAIAMNALGILYNQTGNEKKAIKCFEKAGALGEGKAWHNLGKLYINRNPQDFTRAYQSYVKSAALNYVAGRHSQAYMLYKGFGCQQDYQKAFNLFKLNVEKNHPTSMYFLGLCYRNGYGTITNIDSARYWLKKANSLGEKQSSGELASKTPERLSDDSVKTLLKQVREIKVASSYQKLKHQSQAQNVAGYYTGYAIKYDWSGKHIISISKLDLQIWQKGKNISGTWIEEDTIGTALTATLKDTAVVFDNTSYGRRSHYSDGKPEALEFRDVKLNLNARADSVFLSGSLQMYSLQRREPGKPTFIAVFRTSTDPEDATASFKTAGNTLSIPEKPMGGFEVATLAPESWNVYPNPFNTSFAAEFSMIQAGKARLYLSDIGGRVVYQRTLDLQAGRYSHTVQAELPSATYVLKLEVNGTVQTKLIVKN